MPQMTSGTSGERGTLDPGALSDTERARLRRQLQRLASATGRKNRGPASLHFGGEDVALPEGFSEVIAEALAKVAAGRRCSSATPSPTGARCALLKSKPLRPSPGRRRSWAWATRTRAKPAQSTKPRASEYVFHTPTISSHLRLRRQRALAPLPCGTSSSAWR